MVLSLYMGWRHVLFANWPVDPLLVEPHLPERLTLETYNEHAWLSIVPFTNVDVRPRIFPNRTGIALPELNLRTYVTHGDDPGVYFFSLDADGIGAVIGARLFHHLPYYFARIDLTEESDTINFLSRRRHPGARPARFEATYSGVGQPTKAEPGTLSHFLAERYRYYTESTDGSIRYADIQHDPWPLYEATVEIDENTLFTANSLPTPDTEPVHFYSPGVETIASPSKRIPPSRSDDSR